MKIKLISMYNLGSFILFLGLLWMFLPHITHQKILSSIEETSHLIHIFEGLCVTLAGLGFMLLSTKYENTKN